MSSECSENRSGDASQVPAGDIPNSHADDARDSARWRKLISLIQEAYDSAPIEEDGLSVRADMLFGRGTYRKMEVSLTFADVRDEPVDLGSALDAFGIDKATSPG